MGVTDLYFQIEGKTLSLRDLLKRNQRGRADSDVRLNKKYPDKPLEPTECTFFKPERPTETSYKLMMTLLERSEKRGSGTSLTLSFPLA